jgi:hypothetical protein
MPVGPEHPGMTAGPSFELFYESDYLMPHRGAAWALLEERLHEAAVLSDEIRSDARGSVAEALVPVGAALVDLAASLAAHFGDWGATSRWATGEHSGHPRSATHEATATEGATGSARVPAVPDARDGPTEP